MWIPAIGLLIGIAVGIGSGFVFPAGFSAYVAMGILTCLDSLLGGVYANMRREFQWKVFVTGFFSNAILAIALIWLGNQLSIDLSMAAVVVYGSKMFRNFSNIRHLLLNRNRKRTAEESE